MEDSDTDHEQSPGQLSNFFSSAQSIIGFLAAILALLTAVATGRPASSVAIASFMAIVLALGSRYLWCARKDDNKPKFPRARLLPLALIPLLILSLAVCLSVPSARGYLLNDIFGFGEPGGDISVAQVQEKEALRVGPPEVREDRKVRVHRIEVTIRNKGTRTRLATEILIYIGGKRYAACGSNEHYSGVYYLDRHIQLISSDRSKSVYSGQIKATEGKSPAKGGAEIEFSTSVRISVFGETCYGADVAVAFPLSLAVPPDKYTQIILEIPNPLVIEKARGMRSGVISYSPEKGRRGVRNCQSMVCGVRATLIIDETNYSLELDNPVSISVD